MSIFNHVISYTINKAISPNYYVTASHRETVSILGVQHFIYLLFKNVKTPTMNLIARNIEVILPMKYKKMDKKAIIKILVEKLYDKLASQEIEKIMEKTRIKLGFAPEYYYLERLPNNAISSHSTSQKTITFSPDIIKYTKEQIEYIILHEFCHLKYKIHSKGFWQMLKTYMPNYEQYEKSKLQ